MRGLYKPRLTSPKSLTCPFGTSSPVSGEESRQTHSLRSEISLNPPQPAQLGFDTAHTLVERYFRLPPEQHLGLLVE